MSNLPQSALEELPESFVNETVGSLRELSDLGKPETDEELKTRIDEYFAFCERTGCRPGIESLCIALHITRTTLFRWNAGISCSRRRQEIISTAKQFIAGFLEQCMMRGKLNPASAIFLAKNWLSYKDTVSFEVEDTENRMELPQESAVEIAKRRLKPPVLPDFDDDVNE